MKTNVFVRGLLVISLVGLLSSQVFAAEQSTQRDRETTTQTQQQRRQQIQQQIEQRQQAARAGATAGQTATLQRSSKLIGKEVKNAQGEDLGSIYDLVLTSDHQQVSYAALSSGGTWGFGAKYFAVPWSAFQVGPQGDLILSVSKNQLEQAAGFDRNNWPAQADRQWSRASMTTRSSSQGAQTTTRPGSPLQDRTRDRTRDPGTDEERDRNRDQDREQDPARDREQDPTRDRQQDPDRDRDRTRDPARHEDDDTEPPFAASTRDVQQRRVSNLTGTTVTNAEGEDIGNIEDFVLDARQGQVAYTIVSFGGFWGIGEKYSAVPASAIQLNPRRNTARLDADRKTLESIAFDPDEFPDLSNQQYAQRLHETFNAEPYWTVMGFVSPDQEQAATEQAWGREGAFARHFDAKNVKTVQGTVQSVGTFQPEGATPGASGGLRLRITTDDGNLVTVYAGPQWYAQQHDFYVKPGDKITVTGSETKIGWRPVLVASRIQAGERTLLLRNESGQPQWQVERRGQQGFQGTTTPRPGQGTQRPGDTGQGTQPRPGQGTQQPGGGRTGSGQTQPGQQPDR